MNIKLKALSRFLLVCFTLLLGSCSLQSEKKTDNKKLKIVILMGQSNMVGYAHPRTAWYLTQPLYVPPSKVTTVKSKDFNQGQFYWQGVNFAKGNTEEYNSRGKKLLAEMKGTIKLWRSRVYDNFSRAAKASGKKPDWKTKEWGPAPVSPETQGINRSLMGPFLHGKIRETGVFKRIEEYIESPENKLHPNVAINMMADRDKPIAEDIKRVREIFLNGTKPEDFDKLDEAIKAMGRITDKNRLEYAKLVKKHINLPIAERTHISALGAVAGEKLELPYQARSHGLLTLGFSKFATNCGPEYPFGISFERMVDGPVLIIKCAWGGKSIKTDFRPPSLNTDEEPTGILWKLSVEHINSVLKDLPKYHPGYNPQDGYELSGLVWFQGWNDKGNKDYGNQLVSFIKDFRKEFNVPKLPVVCGLLGHSSWKQTTFDGDVNGGMLYAAQHSDLRGTVDLVNTVKYYPKELGFGNMVKAAYGEDSEEYKKAQSVMTRAISKDPVHYYGSSKFWYLAGDAMALKLANLLNGGEPMIHKEAKEILESK
jgi:hypothetical protein